MNLTPNSKISVAAAAFVAEKRKLNLSRSYVNEVDHSLRTLVKTTADAALRNVAPSEIQSAIDAAGGNSMKRNRFGIFHSFFAWASDHALLIVDQPNPMASLARPSEELPTIEPYSVDEVKSILLHIRDPFQVAAAVIAAFAAAKRGQIAEMEWPDINNSEILLGGGRCYPPKRVVLQLPVLRAWLAPFSVLNLQGPLYSKGILAMIPGNPIPLQVRLSRLRRSYIVNRFAATRDLDRTLQEAGVIRYNGRKVLLRNTADAKAYFELTPENCGRRRWADEIRAALRRRRILQAPGGTGTE